MSFGPPAHPKALQSAFNAPLSPSLRMLTSSPRDIKEQYEAHIQELKAKVVERFSTYGYRRVAIVLGENNKPIQRILQHWGWQVQKRPQGHHADARALPSAAAHADKRWAIDLTMIWCGRD